MKIGRGFEFTETMAGTYQLTGKPEDSRRFSFTVTVHADDALRHMRDGMGKLTGTLEMEAFADEVPLEGTIEIAPVTKKIIRYEFAFVGNDGEPYRFAGQKDIRFRDLLGTWTTLPGAVYDGRGDEIARVRTRFDVKRDFLPWLATFKLVSARP
jgi:hypothetical protein